MMRPFLIGIKWFLFAVGALFFWLIVADIAEHKLEPWPRVPRHIDTMDARSVLTLANHRIVAARGQLATARILAYIGVFYFATLVALDLRLRIDLKNVLKSGKALESTQQRLMDVECDLDGALRAEEELLREIKILEQERDQAREEADRNHRKFVDEASKLRDLQAKIREAALRNRSEVTVSEDDIEAAVAAETKASPPEGSTGGDADDLDWG